LESTLRRLRIHTIKAQLALRELVCRSLAQECANEHLPPARIADIADQWNQTTIERYELRLLLQSQESVQEEAEQQIAGMR
jgi:hypothetical protein